MIESASNQTALFENTEIVKIVENGNGFIAQTNFGDKIVCNKIILATGFNFSLMEEKALCERVISYTIVTKQIKGLNWKHNALIQDDQDPYHYLRILPDNRLIFGGEDTKFKLKPINDKLARKKYDKLTKDLKALLPDYAHEIEVEYKFCGAFGSTENNLGLIGETETPNLYYFLSAGANGIINAMYGAKLMQDIIEGKENPLAHLFSPLRK